MTAKPHIALWSGPRNLSTALMYSFFSRGDLKVFDEPLFGYFLKHTGVWRPSREEALKVMETNAQSVIDKTYSETNAFSKNIANHIEGLDLAFLLPLKNIILTRKPEEVLVSYTKQVESPTLLDLAFEHQLLLLQLKVKEAFVHFLVDFQKSILNIFSLSVEILFIFDGQQKVIYFLMYLLLLFEMFFHSEIIDSLLG